MSSLERSLLLRSESLPAGRNRVRCQGVFLAVSGLFLAVLSRLVLILLIIFLLRLLCCTAIIFLAVLCRLVLLLLRLLCCTASLFLAGKRRVYSSQVVAPGGEALG